MSVATPVLERKADTEEKEYLRSYRSTFMTDDERHNLLISENYAKLINPESKMSDIVIKRNGNYAEKQIAASEEVKQQKPYLVENARADADIFRADNPINRKLFENAVNENQDIQAEEEENEDLRPTKTTIQYKTEGVKRTVVDGKIEVKSEQVKRAVLTKKDKIIIAVALTVIIALFALIIINSVVISHLNSDVSYLQSTLTNVESTYEQALAAKNAYLEEGNLFQVVSDFVNSNGMVLR